MKILIVDDDVKIRRLLEYNLRIDGHTLFQAGNGKQAIQAARKEKPDLILMDIMMPEMNGIEACSIIKNERKTSHIAIFMLTAKRQIRDIDEAFRAGADDYLTKPIEVDRLSLDIKTKFAKFKAESGKLAKNNGRIMSA